MTIIDGVPSNGTTGEPTASWSTRRLAGASVLRAHASAGATLEVAALVDVVRRIARLGRAQVAAVGEIDVVLADAKLLAAERADGHGDAAREAGDARRLGDAIAIVVRRARGSAQAVRAVRIHAAGW